jgi:basic amino acid/polyamine antiporter, APA family
MPAREPHLMRVLRRRDLVGILLNAMIGAGMLAAPAKVYALAGDWSFVVLAAAAFILIPLVLCFADLGSRFSGTGGAYLYAREALPPWLAFAVGWLLWLSQALSVATLSNLLVTYLGGFFPVLESGWARVAVLVGLGVGLTAIVLAGIRQSAGASNLLIVIKVTFVVAFLVAGIAFVQPERILIQGPPPDVPTFAQAILIYLFAYSGFERGAVVAGEARDPQQDVPLALLGSAVIVTFAYAAVILVCVGVLEQPAATDRPLAEVGRQLYGQTGAIMVSAGAIAVIVGTILVITISMPRMLMSLAEQGQLPAVLGKVHPTWRTPYIAILISSTLAFGFAIASDLISALTFATATRLLGYILCCVALFRLSRRSDAPPARFNLPARGVVALGTAALFTGVLLIGATKELPALAGVTVLGFVILLLTQRRAQAPAAP